MPRVCQAVLLVIVLLAGFTARALFFSAAFSVDPERSAGERDIALAFYSALNGALQSGSTDALDSLLSDVFVDHDADSSESRSADEFLAEVRLLGTHSPGIRIEVISVESSGANLVVGIRHTQTEPMRAAGLVVEQPPSGAHVEELRIERGRIVDRWSPGIGWSWTTEFEGIVLHGPGQTDLSITLGRIVIPAGVVQRWYAVGPRFIVVESGSAILSIWHAEREEETLTLERGDAIDVGQAEPVRLRSTNSEPVTVLVYSIVRRSAAELQVQTGATTVTSEGATRSTLWSGPAPSADAGTEHRLATIALPAGGEVRISGATNAAVLVAIDNGAVEIGAPAEDLDAASIDAGRAAFLTGAGEFTLRNVSQQDMTIVLVIVRAEPEGGPAIG